MTESTPTTTVVDRRPAGALSVRPTQIDWSPEQTVALAHLGLEADVPVADLRVFLNYAQRTGLDPFAKQIYLIGRTENVQVGGQWRKRVKYSIQTGIDGFRVIAARTGKYRGQVPPQWCGPDGAWRDVWLGEDRPAACRVGILHADHDAPLYAVALLAEFMPTNKDGEPTGVWRRMPAHMLAKCAEALALRQAFPNDLSGMYTTDEPFTSPAASELPATTLTTEELMLSGLAAETLDELKETWRVAADARLLDEVTDDPSTGERVTLRALLTRLGDHLRQGDTVSPGTDTTTVERAAAGGEWPAAARPGGAAADDPVDAEVVPEHG